jgi:hypothetical protein
MSGGEAMDSLFECIVSDVCGSLLLCPIVASA